MNDTSANAPARPAAAHAPVDGIDRDARGVLRLDGHPVDRLAERAGATPFYAHSTATIARRVARLRGILPPGAHLHYALKANPFPPLLAWMRGRVDGADVASAGELLRCLDAGFDPSTIGFAGPGKTRAEIELAVARGVTITAESVSQLQAAARAGARRVALRVNPMHELRASGMKMGGGASAFGIDEEAVPEALALADSLGVDVVGLHVYSGSQNLRGERIAAAMRAHADAARALMRGRAAWAWLNLGGGFGVPYAAGESELDLGPVRDALHDIAAMLPGVRLRIELGRWLVADAGIYVCRVLECKTSRGRRFVVTDGGLHHHLAATGNFGQVIHRPYPVVNASRHDTEHVVRADVVGPLCTPLDTFGRDLPLAEPRPGDLLAVLRSGAYGRTASPNEFLGHGPCQELLLEGDADRDHDRRG